jgi:hypothetical protein
MINTALRLIRDELADYLVDKKDVTGLNDDDIIVSNIGLFESSNNNAVSERVVISLVNIEEESTLKNKSPLRKAGLTNTALYENPPVFLNLYVLFTCNFVNDVSTGDLYELSLLRLSYIIRFFQFKNSFEFSSSGRGSTVKDSDINDPDIRELKFTLELYTLTFEQINHLWGSLGGRQMPFAMYKLRLVAITERIPLREVPLIEEIETNLSPVMK